MSIKTDPAAVPTPAIEFVLKHPLTSATGVRIERISLRHAKRADLRAAHQFSKDEFEQETFLFARLAGLTMEDVDALTLEDNAHWVEWFRGQLGHSAPRSGDLAAGR